MFISARAVLGVIVLFVTLGAGAGAHAQATDVDCTGCVDGQDIAFKAVTSNKIDNGAVTGGKIAGNAVNSSKMASGAVTASKIAKGAVTSGKLATKAVTTSKIAFGAVTKDKIADNVIVTSKIKNGAVTADKIAADAVGMTQIDPTQVQMRVGGSCEVGSFIASIAEDGAITCEKGGTVTALTANGFDMTPGVAVADMSNLWLDECLTPAYVAGPGETALVTALFGFTLNVPAQGDVIVASFEAGVPTGYGNGYLWVDSKADVTVMHHIDLAEGTEYRFGGMGYFQGGGLTRSRLVCQTMVHIVRPTP